MKTRITSLAAVLFIITIIPGTASQTLSLSANNSSTNTLPVFQRPVAAFTYNPCVLCLVPGDLVFFNATWSTGQFRPITLYVWDFGDGTPAFKTTMPTAAHDYFGAPSKWLVALTVYDSTGQSDTVTQFVIFTVHPSFDYRPRISFIGEPILFNATSSKSYNITSPILAYLWNFGDGSTGIGVITKHVYQFPGIFRVKLTLQTSNGNPQVSETVGVPLIIFHGVFQDINITVAGSISVNSTAREISGSLTVTATNTTSGAVIFSKSPNFTITYSATQPSSFVLAIPAGTEALGVGCSINTNTNDAACVLSKNPDMAKQGTVNIVDISTIALSFGATPGSPKWNSNADLDGDGNVNILDLSIGAFSYGATVIQ